MNKQRILGIILILALTLSLVVACGNEDVEEPATNTDESTENDDKVEENEAEEQYGVTIDENTVSFTDAREKEIVLEKNPERVVVIYNSLLDVWMENGGDIVGRIEESEGQEPIEGIEDAEIVGKLGSISVEKVLALQPDLVISMAAQPSQLEAAESLENNDIPVLVAEYNTKEDYFKLGRLFTALNDREDLYEKNVIDISKGIEDIVEKAPKDKEEKVLLMVASTKSITARGSETTVGEMLDDLHMINIADDSDDTLSSKNFSMEKIIEEDPDYIFVQTTGSDMDKVMERLKEDVESNPAWSELSAVKNDKYIILPKDLYWYKPNDRFVEAYEGLAEIIYPEVFE
ncbi:MAG TPA: ABC transporter substrate-binding protein [Tissierellaceae bacterium]|nr:ABC transporter substrate-binding protein [Tissierellaceae bacterium]